MISKFVFQICAVRSDEANECNVDNGGCSHYCANTYTGFYCECNEGYEIGADGKNCIGKFLRRLESVKNVFYWFSKYNCQYTRFSGVSITKPFHIN